MFKLVISDDEGKTTVVPLVRDEITIGRKEGNTIRLTERNVSRRHARLLKANGKFVVSDLHSYNGVKVNGQRIGGEVPLDPGDQITIGDYQLALQLDTTEATTLPEAATPIVADAQTAMLAAPPPPARIVMITPPAPGAEFALNREKVRIGRAEDLDVWVNHRSISREHAEIQKAADGWRLIDLGSANGVRVNGRDVQNALLEPGDVVELGQVRFRFVGVGEQYAFEADRTVQMDAVALDTPGSRGGSKAPIFVAIAIVALAIVGAVAVAMIGGGGDDTPVAQPIDQPDPNPIGPDPTPTVSDDARFAQALEGCQAAFAAGHNAQALTHAEAALVLRPDDEQAIACRDRANAVRAEEDSFTRGVEHVNRGELSEAYAAFEELPAESALRNREEVRDAMQRFARLQLNAARDELATHPNEALHKAQLVLSMTGITDSMRNEARGLEQQARRHGPGERPGPHEEPGPQVARPGPHPPRGHDTPPDGPAHPPPHEAPPDEAPAANLETQARDCTMRGNNPCVIRLLEGHAQSANAMAMLIEAYRAVGDQGRALSHMRTYVSRYRGTPRAQAYSQILARQQ